MFHRLVLIFSFSLLAPSTWAQQEPVASIQKPQEAQPVVSRIRGLLDIELPTLDPPGTFKLILYPHISDLVRREYIRTDLGFRWALNDHFELSSAASTYITHGLGSADTSDYGLGEMRYGLKYVFQKWLRPDFDSSISVAVKEPVGQPPVDLTDGLNHYAASFVIQHRWKRYSHLSTFAGTTLDFVDPSDAIGEIQTNKPRDNSLSWTVGGLYDMGQLKWTLSGTFATTALIGDRSPDNFFYLQPGLIWYVPKRLALRSKTQWVISLSTPMSWGPDGYDISVTNRLRAEITFRQVVASMRGAGAK
jgi:hypothetical protein